MNSRDLLETLIAFPTVSRDPNRALIDWIAATLKSAGIDSTIIPNADGTKANLFATIGPTDRPGVMLSGHTDVVPIDGQDWTVPAFEMTERDGKLFGRGTCDMKGFVACAMKAAIDASGRDLQTPLHLAFSYDEELGCLGVHSLIDMLRLAPHTPSLCIVGEPTNMAVATGHKGKVFLKATCIGEEAHSSLAPMSVNAIHLATDLVGIIRDLQADVASNGHKDGDYDVPYTTLHVGKIYGGVMVNIVPNHCEVLFEIRNLAEDDPQQLVARIKDATAPIVSAARKVSPNADIRIEQVNAYPGLATDAMSEAVAFVKQLTGANNTMKVAFGTEGGLFHQQLGIPTVVCGPGSMAQGHKPDEFVTVEQMERCDGMLERLVANLG